jgi:hypothetical protein
MNEGKEGRCTSLDENCCISTLFPSYSIMFFFGTLVCILFVLKSWDTLFDLLFEAFL